MNPVRLLLVTSVISASVFAQTQSAFGNVADRPQTDTLAKKDPQAIARMARMLVATRWSALIRDAVVEGTMTNAADPSASPRPFTLKMRGSDAFRFDTADGSASTILNGLAGVIVRGDKVTRLPVHVARDRGFMLPMFSLLVDSDAMDVDVADGDPQQVKAVECTEVKLERKFAEKSALNAVLSRISDATVCISAEGLPLRVRHTRAALDNQTALFEETIIYSDFRSIRGVLVPFKEDFFLDGQPTTTIQFDKIDINSAPPDDVFHIPTIATAGGAR